MSFNLIYADKGIDFSGFAEGVSNGMKMRFQQEKYEQSLYDNEMKQFQLMWKPDKLKPVDKEMYMTAIEEYKRNRKNELKLDKKWFVKPEERQAAYEKSEKAKAIVGHLYSSSQMANNYLEDATKTVNTYRQQKVVPPTDLLNTILMVRNTKSTEIDFDKLAPAGSFSVMPSADDMIKYSTSLANDKLYPNTTAEPDAQKPYEQIPDSVPYLKGKKIYFRKVYRYMEPESAYSEAKHIEGTRMENKATVNYNSFASALQADPTSRTRIEADNKAAAISKAANIPVANIDKFHLWAYDNHMYDKKFVKDVEDKSEIELALRGLDALNDAESMKLKKMLAANTVRVGNSNISLNNMYKFLNYIKSPQAEAAFKASTPDNMFKSIFTDYGLDAIKYFKAIKNLQIKGSKESVIDLYNKLNTGDLSLDELSKQEDQ